MHALRDTHHTQTVISHMAKQIEIESSTLGINLIGQLDSVSSNTLVIFFSGSGAQDLDETIDCKKPFYSLSIKLNQAGYDVFRWNDRGINGSEGDYYSSSAIDIVNDGINVISYFRDNANYNRILLLGHSQGTLIATKVATVIDVDALILCAGIFRNGKVALLDQHINICTELGYTYYEIENSVKQKEGVFNLLINFENLNEGNDQTDLDLKEQLREYFFGGEGHEQLSRQEIKDIEFLIDDFSEWEWRFILTENIITNLKKLNIPILVLFGEKDIQVNTVEELEYLNTFKLKNIKSCVLTNHNHLFQLCKNGSIENYKNLGEPFTEKSVAEITNWMKNEI